MPRKGKSTKACQTDQVILSEQGVENIVLQQLSDLSNIVKRLEAEVKDLRSNGVNKMSSSELVQGEKVREETVKIFGEEIKKYKQETDKTIQNLKEVVNEAMKRERVRNGPKMTTSNLKKKECVAVAIQNCP